MTDGQELPEEFSKKQKEVIEDPFDCDCESCVRVQRRIVNER